MTYDIETLLIEIDTMLKANLNTEIEAVSNDKADGLSLPLIGENAYAIQSLDDKVQNYDNYVFTQVTDIKTIGTGPNTSEDYTIGVWIVAGGTANQLQQSQRMFRYLRALKRTFEKYWDKTSSLKIKLKIESIPPQDVINLNTSKYFRVVGVQITGAIA